MGIDYYTCDNEDCRNNFPDCISYFVCDTCESIFCNKKCAKAEHTEEYSDTYNCMYCRNEEATDSTLLCFLLRKYQLDRQQVLKMYQNDLEPELKK